MELVVIVLIICECCHNIQVDGLVLVGITEDKGTFIDCLPYLTSVIKLPRNVV